MILSTKGRYAVMAMVELATHDQSKPITLAMIAERQDIPLAYLEQIFAKLKKAGLVESMRGPGGGYRLAAPAAQTCVADIVQASEESIEMTRCGGVHKSGCIAPKTRCLTHDLWQGLTQHIHGYLAAITLADVCNNRLPVTPAKAGSHTEAGMDTGLRQYDKRIEGAA